MSRHCLQVTVALLCLAASCRSTPPTTTIDRDKLTVTGIDPCIKEIAVTLRQNGHEFPFTATPSGGAFERKISRIDFSREVDITVTITKTDVECVVKAPATFHKRGTFRPNPTDANHFELTFADFKPVPLVTVVRDGVHDDCLERVRKRLIELVELLGLDMKGTTINVVFGPLPPGVAAETRPDKGNANSVTMTISKLMCTLDAKHFDISLAHELDHATRETSTPPGDYRTSEETRLAADEADKLAHQPPINAFAMKAAEHDYYAARVAALKQLRAEEEKAYDSTRANKDKLGLTDADLRENDTNKTNALADLDQQIRNAEQEAARHP
jgi:hypothetical protein